MKYLFEAKSFINITIMCVSLLLGFLSIMINSQVSIPYNPLHSQAVLMNLLQQIPNSSYYCIMMNYILV